MRAPLLALAGAAHAQSTTAPAGVDAGASTPTGDLPAAEPRRPARDLPATTGTVTAPPDASVGAPARHDVLPPGAPDHSSAAPPR